MTTGKLLGGPTIRSRFWISSSPMLILILAGAVLAAPVTTNTALPAPEGEFIVRQLVKYIRSTDDPSPMDRELEVVAIPTAIVFGATEKLALFAVLPYMNKSMDVTAGVGRVTRGDAGFGDARLFARYTAAQWDSKGQTLRLAPFAGVELPTGQDDETDALGRLPSPLQLGSGSWDPFAGVVATYQVLDYQIDASLGYKLNTEASSFGFGDEARFDASLQYRLWPRKLSGGLPGFLYGVVEANLIHRGKNEIGGSDDPNSGGITLFVAPGLQYVTKRWIIEAIVQLPAMQDLNGTALGDDYIVRAGVRINF